jgi:L-lactate utilization protein LutC
MNSRDRILQKLRVNRPFEDAPPSPESYLPITRLEEADLVARFRAEVERLTGRVHTPADAEEAIELVLEIVGESTSVMTWEALPLPGLTDALTARGVSMIVPHARGDRTVLIEAEQVRVGITGASAAFAATGTLALATNAQQGRLPSLLPPVHITLLSRERLLPRFEDWITAEARASLATSNSIALITGPSRTGDIEMQTIVGVHGPGILHVIVI